MLDMFVNAELSVLRFLDSIHNPVTDRFFVFVTHLGDKGLLWIIIGIVFCVLKKYRRIGITMLLALLMMLVIGNLTLKPIIARIRPYEHMGEIQLLIQRPTDFSFPSGHTFSSFAAACSVMFYDKKMGICAIILAILIAFSRLYLCVHFPTDVLCGLIMGIGTAYLSRFIVENLKWTKNI